MTLRARRPALWAWLEADDPDVRFSDNFVHLRSGRTVRIRTQPSVNAAQLRVRSLADTYLTAGRS